MNILEGDFQIESQGDKKHLPGGFSCTCKWKREKITLKSGQNGKKPLNQQATGPHHQHVATARQKQFKTTGFY